MTITNLWQNYDYITRARVKTTLYVIQIIWV